MATFTPQTKSSGAALWSAYVYPWQLNLPWQYDQTNNFYNNQLKN